MFLPALINWDTLIESVGDDAFEIYIASSKRLPVPEHIVAEQILYEVPEHLNEHYVTIERREPGDMLMHEPFTEHTRLYEAVEGWFAWNRLTSDVRPAKGGGFSCMS